MEALTNYIDYRKNKPSYKSWKNAQDEKEAKRLAYIEKYGISEEQKQNDIKRAKAVLNAVDIMDEYSQSRAEETEMLTQPVISTIASISSSIGFGLGCLLMLNKKTGKILDTISKQKNIEKNTLGMGLATAIGVILSMPAMFGAYVWGTKKEIEASRIGRHEAMNKDLASIKQFAVLNDEQETKRDEISKTIKIEEKDAKKAIAHVGGLRSLLNSIKNLVAKNKEYEKSKEEFNKKLQNDKAKFDTVEVSEKDLLEAKKDQQLIANVVEKIDIASQDYAENIELATSTISTLAIGSGGLLGFITNKIVKNINFKNPIIKKALPFGIGIAATCALSLIGVKLQKDGSRVARFKVKQDFLNNPEKLYYVDDEKAKNEDGSKHKSTQKVLNIFKFIPQALKDHKEYKQYIKENNIKEKQKRLAQEQIELTPEQEKRAKQLQNNVFKTFNAVDDKSQKYSESTELVGEAALSIVSLFASIIPIATITKSLKNINSETPIFKRAGISGIATFIPIVLANVFITKEQKNASRVADMLALKELEDVRNYVDYSENIQTKDTTPQSKYLKS